MSRIIADAELDVYKPGEDMPFVTIPGDDLPGVEIDERIQDAMDSGELAITNHDALYSTDYEITTGDKLVFRVQLAEETGLTDYWTAIVRDPTDVLEGGGRQRLDIGATDFVFTILSWRLAYESLESAPISGSQDAILDSLLSDAPEIDTSQVSTISQTTDGFYNGRDLLSIITEDLAPIADAVVGQDGTSLVFKPLSNVTSKYTLTPSDFRGEIEISRVDDDVANLVRVDGGTDHDSDASQETQSSYERVTDTSRLTTQVPTRKSEIDRIQVYTRVDDTSSDGLTVRLQADRNGSPVAVDDQTSDIARKTLDDEFLATDGWTTFLLPSHTLPPQSYPWLIIEADGDTGHDIGVDGSGVPAYRAEYPFPLLARIPDADSQSEYRRRDYRIKDDSLNSFPSVRDKARSYLRHHNDPERTVSGEAESIRAHQLSPGEAVDMQEWGRVGLSGTWVCRERATEFDGSTNRLSTTLTLQEADSL